MQTLTTLHNTVIVHKIIHGMTTNLETTNSLTKLHNHQIHIFY